MIEERLATLEGELKELKDELRAILLDIRGMLLERGSPLRNLAEERAAVQVARGRR